MQWACALFVVCVLPGSIIFFSHYLINDKIFEDVIEHKICVWFSQLLCLKHFSFQEERSEILSKLHINLHVTNCHYCPILMKLEYSGQIFEKYLDIKFHENSFSGSQVVTCGRTDWHDEANSLFSQFLRKCLNTKQFGVYRDV